MGARINIDEELQGWVLLFATVTAVFFFCLPSYCAGLSWAPARRFAAWLSQRLPSFYLCTLVFNAVFVGLIIHALPDWTLSKYLGTLAKFLATLLQQTLESAGSIAVIGAFCIAVAFKDRIAQLCGVDHKTLFRFKIRDCLSCFGGARHRPIEVAVWKVEDLPSADLFSANNVFVELFLGYNEPMKTRVHNNAGSGCLIKESIHLNFDEDDDEETLYIFVRNQKVMGTGDLARGEVSAAELKKDVEAAEGREVHRMERGDALWSGHNFREITLIPRGKIWLQVRHIRDADYDHSLLQDMTTC